MNKEQKHTGPVFTVKDGINVIECEKCGFRHIDPLPTMEDVLAFYGKDYYEEIKPEMLSNYEESLDWFNQMYDDRLILLEEEQNGVGRILDIGAGAGYFLKRARDREWEYHGIEASRAACNYAAKYNDIKIQNTIFENASLNELGKFDAINMSEVIEHVVNPRLILERCYSLLNTDGILFMMVPNEFNALQMLANELYPENSDYWVIPDHHYNYFSEESIKHLLDSVGFEVFKKEVSFPIELLLVAGQNYLQDRDISKNFYDIIKTAELTLIQNDMRELKRDIYSRLADAGIGRDLMI